MAAVGVVQVVIVGWIVVTSGFQQDDYLFFTLGRNQGFSVDGLTRSVFGSLIPGFNFVNAFLASSLPVERWAVVVLTLAMYGVLIVVFYRLLELLFGARPGIILLTSVANCSGLLGVSLVWWTPAINGLPALIADLLALDGLIRHGLTGRVRYLVVSVVSFAVGTLFYDPSMEVLLPLVLVTLLYQCDLHDRHAVWMAFRSRAWVWAGYLVPIVASFGWRFLHPGRYSEPPIGTISQMTGFIVGGLTKGLTSSALGVNYITLGPGAWTWGILVLGQTLLFGVIAVTIIVNRQSWRAWTLFLVSFLAADFVAAVGRSSQAFYFQFNSLYWCYFLFLFFVALGLAVLPSRLTAPLASPEPAVNPPRIAQPVRRGWATASVVATVVLCALGIHYIWTTPDHTLGARNRVFTQHLQSAWVDVSRHHRLAFVWDTAVPPFVLSPNFQPVNKVSTTMGLVIGGLRIDRGSGPGFLVVGDGSLIPASSQVLATQAASSAEPGVPSPSACFGSGQAKRMVHVLFDHEVRRGSWFVRIAYRGSRGEILGINSTETVFLPKGDGMVLAHLPAPRPVRTVLFTSRRDSHVCDSATIETPVPVRPG